MVSNGRITTCSTFVVPTMRSSPKDEEVGKFPMEYFRNLLASLMGGGTRLNSSWISTKESEYYGRFTGSLREPIDELLRRRRDKQYLAAEYPFQFPAPRRRPQTSIYKSMTCLFCSSRLAAEGSILYQGSFCNDSWTIF